MNKQTIDLDVITGGVPQVLHVSQYDTGARTLEFNIYASNNDLDLTGATAKISGKKPDGLGFEYPATISDGVVSADCTDQMTAVAGIVECAITLTDSDGQIQTARFDLNVKPAPLNDDTVISDSDFPLIQRAIGAEEDAEAWAVGTRNGEPVPVSDPTYENNSKYWAEQAAQTDIGQIEKVKVSWNDAEKSVKKNLLVYPYTNTSGVYNGTTVTDNGDGTLKLNGTSTAVTWLDLRGIINNSYPYLLKKGSYIFSVEGLSGGLQGGIYKQGDSIPVASVSANTQSKLFTLTSDTYLFVGIRIGNGEVTSNVTVKPMLRLASIKDDTYAPYIPDNTELTTWKANGVLGAKNLIPYPYYRESGYTHNGMTSTYDSDGVITVNGTSTNTTAYFGIFNSATSSIALKPNTDYILSMKLQDATNTSIFLANNSVDIAAIRNKASGYYEHKFRTPATLGTLTIALYWGTGVTETNTKINPMLRLAEDTDDTYQPYAMTNYELTQKIADLQAQINALI